MEMMIGSALTEKGGMMMVDREKVIKGLECHAGLCSESCPYYNITDFCFEELCMDAIELLKEQEGQIERLEHDLAVTQNNLNYYVNGND